MQLSIRLRFHRKHLSQQRTGSEWNTVKLHGMTGKNQRTCNFNSDKGYILIYMYIYNMVYYPRRPFLKYLHLAEDGGKLSLEIAFFIQSLKKIGFLFAVTKKSPIFDLAKGKVPVERRQAGCI